MFATLNAATLLNGGIAPTGRQRFSRTSQCQRVRLGVPAKDKIKILRVGRGSGTIVTCNAARDPKAAASAAVAPVDSVSMPTYFRDPGE